MLPAIQFSGDYGVRYRRDVTTNSPAQQDLATHRHWEEVNPFTRSATSAIYQSQEHPQVDGRKKHPFIDLASTNNRLPFQKLVLYSQFEKTERKTLLVALGDTLGMRFICLPNLDRQVEAKLDELVKAHNKKAKTWKDRIFWQRMKDAPDLPNEEAIQTYANKVQQERFANKPSVYDPPSDVDQFSQAPLYDSPFQAVVPVNFSL